MYVCAHKFFLTFISEKKKRREKKRSNFDRTGQNGTDILSIVLFTYE
jgi:hypothetical protein